MTFSASVQGLVLLAFLMCIPHSLGEPWPKSQFGQSGDSDVHIQKSGVVRHTAGEGLSVTDTGIYRLRSRESKYHENYKVSQDPDERPVVRESLPGSPWQQEVVEEEEEEVEEVDLRDASQEELLAYMEQRNKVLERALAEALDQRSPDYVAGTRVVPSHYGAEGPPHTRRRRPLILPVKVLVNTPEGGQGGYPDSGGPGLANGTTSPLDSRGGRNPADPYDRNNETPEWIRRLQGTDALPVAPETNINPLQSPRSSTDSYSQQRGGRNGLSTPDPWIKQNSFPRGGQDPRTNQGINRLTTPDPWIDMNNNQGTGNQGRNAFLNTNQNQGTNQDPWKNMQGRQRTSSYPFSNQGRNQGTNQFTDQRGNQGTTHAYPFANQNRNQAPRTGPWVNMGKNQGTSIFPQANQGRNQGINRYPQRTNTSPFTNQGKNPGGSPFPSRNQGNNPHPSPNQRLNQPIDPLPLPSQLPNFFPPITQGQNQGTNFLPLPTQGQNQGTNFIPLPTQGQRQQLGSIPLANQNRFQTTTTYPSGNQGRNQGSYVTTNQRRNQERNAFTSPNQRRNQNTNSGRWSNRGRNQATSTNAWKNEARNQENTGPWNSKNTNQGTARSNSYSRSNQRNTRGRNSQSIYPGSTSYQNTRGTNSPYPRSPFRKQNDFSNAWPTKTTDTKLEGSDKETSSGDDNHSTEESATSSSKGQSIFSHINDNTDSPNLNSRRRSLNQYTEEPATDQQSTNYPTLPPHTQPPSQRSIYSSSKRNLPSPGQSTEPQQPKSHPPRSTKLTKDKSPVGSVPKKQNKEQSRSPYSPPPEYNKPTPIAPTSETIPSRKRRNVQQQKSQLLPSTTQPQGDKSSVSSDPKKQTKEERKSPYSPPPEHNKPTLTAPTSETIPSRKRRNVQQSKSQLLLSTSQPQGDKSSEISDPKKQNTEQRKSPYSPPPEHNKPTPDAPTSETVPSRKRRNVQQSKSQLLTSTTQPQGDKSSMSSDPKKQNKEHSKSPYSPPPEHNEPTTNTPTSETIPSRKRRDMHQSKSQPLPSTTQPQGDKSPVDSVPKKQNKEQRSPYSPPPKHNEPTPNAPTSETIPSRKRRNVEQSKSQLLPSTTQPQEDKSSVSSDPKEQTKEQRKSPYSPPPEHNKPTLTAPTSETIPSRKRRNVQQQKSHPLPPTTQPQGDKSSVSSDPKEQTKEERKSPYSPPPEHNKPTLTAPTSETIPSRKRRNVQQPEIQPLPSTKSKEDKSPESSDPKKQNKEHRKSPYSPPPEHNQPTPNAPTSETIPSRKRRNAQPFEPDFNQGPPPPPARNGYAGHSPSDFNYDDPFMTSEEDNRHDDSQYYDYPTGPYDTDRNQQQNTDSPGREVHGQNPNFQPRPDLKYYNYKPPTQPQRKRPPPPNRTYPSLEPNPPRKNTHRTFDDREQRNPPRENKPRQYDDRREQIGDEGRQVHGVNPNFKPARKQKLRPKQYYHHKHRPGVPYTDSSVQMHPSLRRKRDVREGDNEHINIHLSPRSFETRVIISSPVEVERFKNKRSNAEEPFPSRNIPNFPSISAYRGSYASSGRERNVRSSALRKETKDSRGFVGHRAKSEGNSGEPVTRAASRARFSKSRYAPAGSTYYKAGAPSRDSRRISSRQRSQKPRYNDGYGYSNRYNPRYAHVLGGGGGRGRGGGGVYIYSPAQNSGYGSRRRRGGIGYHRNQRRGSGGGYNVPVIENGITALVQIFNNSENKGAASGTKGGSSQQTGSHFLYNPSTEDLQLVSDSATNGVSTQDDLEGAYFQYNPDTEELKLVTSDDQFVSDVDKASNNSRSSSSSTKNNDRGSQGAFFTYDPATQKLKLSTDTGTGATTSNSPYQAQVPSSPFSGSKGSQLVGLIQLENNKAKAGGTSGSNGGYLQFDPSNSGTTTTSNQQNPQDGQGGIEEIKIFVQDGAGGGTAKQDPQQKVVGYVVVDGGSATFLAPNPGASGGYIQFSPVGAGAGTVLQGGGGAGQYLTHEDFAHRPLVKPGPDLFLRMFTEGEVFLEGDAIVQNFYTDGDVRRMVSHFRALPLEQSRMGSGFMTGRLKGYHVTACRQCGPSNRPMIEFVTLYDTSPKVVRRFHYRMRRYGGNVGWSSSTHPYADGKRQPSLYFGTYPYKNQPQFGVPRFRNQLFDDLSAKKQNKNKNSGRQRRE